MATAAPSLKGATEAVVLPITLEWTIKDFVTLCDQHEPPLESPVYQYEGMDFKLQVNYLENEFHNDRYFNTFSVKFALVKCKYPLPFSAYYYVFIEKNGKDVFPGRVQKNWTSFEALETYVELVWKIEYRGARNDPFSYLNGCNLTIKCNLWIKVDTKHEAVQCHPSTSLKIPEGDLKADLSSLLRDGRLSDVTLVAGEQTFPAHTLILAARSPVFEKMFEHEMKESATSRVGITDIEPPVLQELLLYIYTGELSSKDHKKLLYAADKYQLDRLKVLCGLELSKTLSVDNVAECLCLADSHNASQLREKCVGYIARNRSAVMKTPGWAEVALRSELVLEILQATTTNT